jgi:hypothetical protein
MDVLLTRMFMHLDTEMPLLLQHLPIDAIMSDPAVESRNLELTALHFVPISSGF